MTLKHLVLCSPSASAIFALASRLPAMVNLRPWSTRARLFLHRSHTRTGGHAPDQPAPSPQHSRGARGAQASQAHPKRHPSPVLAALAPPSPSCEACCNPAPPPSQVPFLRVRGQAIHHGTAQLLCARAPQGSAVRVPWRPKYSRRSSRAPWPTWPWRSIT